MNRAIIFVRVRYLYEPESIYIKEETGFIHMISAYTLRKLGRQLN